MDWPSIAREVGQTGVVALGAIWLFLKAFDRWGDSRDEERRLLLDQIERQDQRSQEVTAGAIDAIVSLVELAKQMVCQCQAGVPPDERVTTEAIAQAAARASRRKPPKET